MHGITAFLLLLAALPLACSATGTQKKHERPPELQKKYEEAVERGEIKLGMTREEVRKIKGKPQKTERTTMRGRKVEAWLYPWTEFYFDMDGYLVGMRSAEY